MPMTIENALKNVSVFLSASLPEDLVNTPRAQDLFDLLVTLGGDILSAGGTLLFGGHPSVTPLIHRLAKDSGEGDWSVRLFQADQFRGIAPKQVFDASVEDASVRTQATLLEAIHDGIVRQLAVLDDVGITGTGRSSAELLGLSAETLAEKLTGHLVREIVVRGSRGGPLEPLAVQLNHRSKP